jgi:predicted small secreted protein
MKTNKTNHVTLVQQLVLLFLAMTLLAVVGVGCNTAHGFGKDMERAGEKIQDGTN